MRRRHLLRVTIATMLVLVPVLAAGISQRRGPLTVALSLMSLSSEEAVRLDQELGEAIQPSAAPHMRPRLKLRHRPLIVREESRPTVPAPEPAPAAPSPLPLPSPRAQSASAPAPSKLSERLLGEKRLIPSAPAQLPGLPVSEPAHPDLSGRLLEDARRALHERPLTGPREPGIPRLGASLPRQAKKDEARLFAKPGPEARQPASGQRKGGTRPDPKRGPGPMEKGGVPPQGGPPFGPPGPGGPSLPRPPAQGPMPPPPPPR